MKTFINKMNKSLYFCRIPVHSWNVYHTVLTNFFVRIKIQNNLIPSKISSWSKFTWSNFNMLICVRYNLILLKFDIVKLLLCNTITTTNANEIKALTRVESEFFCQEGASRPVSHGPEPMLLYYSEISNP